MWIATFVLASSAWAAPKVPTKVQAALDQAEVAWRANDLEKAEDLLTEATTAAPTLARAWRRRCGVVLATGRTMDAIELCRTAVALESTTENRTALALALVRDAADIDPATAPGMEEARKLIDGVVAENADYVQAWAAMCEWARLADDMTTAERCVTALERLEPEKAGTQYFRALLDAARGSWDHARTSLIAARNHGLTDDLYQPLAARITAATAERPSRADAAPEPQAPPAGEDVSPLLPLAFAGVLLLLIAGIALRAPDGEEPPPPADPPAPPDAADAPPASPDAPAASPDAPPPTA